MSTTPDTLQFWLDHLKTAGVLTWRKMFGEYALYLNSIVVAFICDDQLFVKPTAEGQKILGEVTLAPAYPGSKDYFLIEESQADETELLSRLLQATAAAAPAPKPKKAKKPRSVKA